MLLYMCVYIHSPIYIWENILTSCVKSNKSIGMYAFYNMYSLALIELLFRIVQERRISRIDCLYEGLMCLDCRQR